MALRHLMIAGAFAAAVAVPAAAIAATGHTAGDVSLRAGPGTQYGRIAVIPAGSSVEVRGCTNWCVVLYRGYSGWVSATYIAMGSFYERPALRVYFRFGNPPPHRNPPPYRTGWCPGPGMGAPCIAPGWQGSQ